MDRFGNRMAFSPVASILFIGTRSLLTSLPNPDYPRNSRILSGWVHHRQLSCLVCSKALAPARSEI